MKRRTLTPPDVEAIERAVRSRGWGETLDTLCRTYRCAPSDVCGDSSVPHLLHARRELWWWMRDHGWSTPAIGELFRRDHSTVLTGTRQYAAGKKLAS